jgi:hypothetical protein
MRKQTPYLLLFVALAGLVLFQAKPWAALDPATLRAPNCLNCHSYPATEPLVLGDFQSYSNQAKLLTVKVGQRSLVIKVTEGTKLVNAAAYRDLTGDNALKVSVEEKPDGLYAQVVTVKPPLKVPGKQLMSTEELAKLVALGPEKGQYVLLDSRPPYRFQEERIPGALNQPLPNFDKLTNLLPQDKSQMVIFYCQGFT